MRAKMGKEFLAKTQRRKPFSLRDVAAFAFSGESSLSLAAHRFGNPFFALRSFASLRLCEKFSSRTTPTMALPGSTRLVLLCLALLLIAPLRAPAEVVDRIAASVGLRVITQSDLDRAIRVAAFQDGVKLDFSPPHKQAVAQALIEQKLIQVELESSRYPLPDPAELVPAIERFKKQQFPDEAAYQASLAEYGITEQDFRDMLLWQRTLLLFVQMRFETGVQLTDQEVEEYFEKTVKPAAQAAHPGEPVTIDDFRQQIAKTLTTQRSDRQLDAWLRDVRRRTNIVVHEEVLR
jgi:hypothetical protein